MTKFHVTLAALAAFLTLAEASTSAFADTNSGGVAAADHFAAREATVEAGTMRKIDLQAEPIEQIGQITEPENQPTDHIEAAPEAAAPDTVDAAANAAAAPSAATSAAEPQTARRICRKFSAAIAMVIEVPCETAN